MREAVSAINGQLFTARVDEPDVRDAPFVVFTEFAQDFAIAVVFRDNLDGDDGWLSWGGVGSGPVVEDADVEEPDQYRFGHVSAVLSKPSIWDWMQTTRRAGSLIAIECSCGCNLADLSIRTP